MERKAVEGAAVPVQGKCSYRVLSCFSCQCCWDFAINLFFYRDSRGRWLKVRSSEMSGAHKLTWQLERALGVAFRLVDVWSIVN
jgi:hypothetical protein